MYSYSGNVSACGALVNASHVDGQHPVHGLGQEFIYMMTCTPLANHEDIKPLMRDAMKVVTPPKEEYGEYTAIKFCLAQGEQGTLGS
jgi:hypothetical protein